MPYAYDGEYACDRCDDPDCLGECLLEEMFQSDLNIEAAEGRDDEYDEENFFV